MFPHVIHEHELENLRDGHLEPRDCPHNGSEARRGNRFTTFSAFSYETASLIEDDAYLRAGAYLLGSNLLAISACFAGIWMVRRLA